MKKNLNHEKNRYRFLTLKLLLTMKLAIFIICFSTFGVFASSSYSQVTKLSLNMDNTSIKEVLLQIEKKSEFYFLYNNNLVDVEKKVDIIAKEKKISVILDKIFKGQEVEFSFMNRQIIISPNDLYSSSASPQLVSKPVTGKVSDENQSGLPGVNVIVKGTALGTVTDVEGNYSLEVPDENTILIFSSVGYIKEEITVGAQSVIDMVMAPDITRLDELVVIGYGTMKRSDLTGAVATADIESFRETANISVLQSLQGNVAGLNVGPITQQGAAPAMSIRGLNTLSGTTRPLIVLDDVIFRGRVTDINPNDIESVTVLKDASSAAIYGSQAANGVIIITSKRAEAIGKPVFTYSGSIGFQNPKELWTPMNREQFLEKNKDVWWRQAYTEESGYLEPNPDWIDQDALVTIHQDEGYDDGTDTDWGKSAIRTGILNDHNLSMQSKGKSASTYMSLGYTDSKGYVQNDNFKRLSTRFNVDYDIFDWLKVGAQTFLTVSDYEGRGTSMSGIMRKSPLAKSHNEDGSIYLYPDGFLTPLYYQETEQLDKYTTLYGNFYVDLDVPFVKGLTYKLNYNPNYLQHRLYTYNPFSNSETGAAEKQHTNNYNYALDNRINYRQTFGGSHSIDLTIAAGREKRTNDYTSAYSGQFALQGLDWNRLQDGSVEKQQTTAGAWQETSMYYMGRLVYNYSDRYILTGTLRRDGFSGFGANNKYALFPSAAFGWRFTEEGFLKDKISWLDNGKIRVSYGENGNRTVSRYQTLAKMTSDFGYTFGGSSAFWQTTSTLANADLKWETTSSFNLGFDFAVLNSRINGAIEYYYSTTNDMLYNVPLPNMGGISSTFINLGEIKNKGLEITINSINLDINDFRWNSTVSYSRNRNEIVSLLGKDHDGDGIEDDLISSGLFIGKSINAIYTYNVLGLYQLGDTDMPSNSGPGLYKYEDIGGHEGAPDGVISSEYDRKIIGYEDPAYRWSFKNTFSYKNFSLMIFLNSIQGGNGRYIGSISGPTGGSRDDNVRRDNYGIEHSEFWWTPQNTDSPFKELFAYDPVQNNRYFQRSFVRLQDVSLSYRLNSSTIKKLGIQDLNIFVSGKNLITWTDWYGLDPETGHGFMTSHPLLKNYTCGINLSF